jgi:hypothetical protein
MLTSDKIIEFFVEVNDFCREYGAVDHAVPWSSERAVV